MCRRTGHCKLWLCGLALDCLGRPFSWVHRKSAMAWLCYRRGCIRYSPVLARSTGRLSRRRFLLWGFSHCVLHFHGSSILALHDCLPAGTRGGEFHRHPVSSRVYLPTAVLAGILSTYWLGQFGERVWVGALVCLHASKGVSNLFA